MRKKVVDIKKFQHKIGMRLDLGCGESVQPNFVGMDKKAYPDVDIVHDAQDFPYPIPDNSCITILMSHLWEHIEPKYRMDLMEELWRIMKPNGQLLISVPYYLSIGANQDPTHYPCPNEITFTYFDPNYPMYNIYKPSPWKIIGNDYKMVGNLEVIMEAVKTPPKTTKKGGSK